MCARARARVYVCVTADGRRGCVSTCEGGRMLAHTHVDVCVCSQGTIETVNRSTRFCIGLDDERH